MLKSILWFLLILGVNVHLSAQPDKSGETYRVELGVGKIYNRAFDVNANNCDGFGPITFDNIDGKLFKNPHRTKKSGYAFINFVLPNKLVLQTSILNYTSGYNTNSLEYPQTGMNSLSFTINTIGAGYRIPINKFNISLIGNVAYRKGLEGYVVTYLVNTPFSEPIIANIKYNNPYGISLNSEIVYLYKQFGVGLNLGFYYFPFEKAALRGNDVEVYYPEIVANTLPIKQLLTASFYLSYNFNFSKTP